MERIGADGRSVSGSVTVIRPELTPEERERRTERVRQALIALAAAAQAREVSA